MQGGIEEEAETLKYKDEESKHPPNTYIHTRLSLAHLHISLHLYILF